MSRPLPFAHPANWLSTWFGVGLMPYAPGTWGSAAAIPFAYAFHLIGGPWLVLGAAAAGFAVGIWASDVYARRRNVKDPRQVVIDEVVGQWIVLAGAPLVPGYYFAAFALFRFFDIVKPWPASWADRDLAGGLGIMLDDVIAGIYGLGVLLLIRYALGAIG